MNPTQQRYSICDQELLALVMALDKLSHLLRVSKVTVYTDHQALTHLQRVQASKPLRGRIAQWLDFSAEFPDLHITYVQGGHNQGADALFRRPGLPNTSLHDTPSAGLMLAIGQVRAAPRSRGRPAYRELPGDLDDAACSPHLHLRSRNPNQRRNILHSQRRHQLTLVMCANGRELTRSVPFFAFPTRPQQTNQGMLCKSSFVIANSPFATCTLARTSAFMDCAASASPQFPEFLTEVLHSHHDHVTAGH